MAMRSIRIGLGVTAIFAIGTTVAFLDPPRWIALSPLIVAAAILLSSQLMKWLGSDVDWLPFVNAFQFAGPWRAIEDDLARELWLELGSAVEPYSVIAAFVRKQNLLVRFDCLDSEGSRYLVLSRLRDGRGVAAAYGLFVVVSTSAITGAHRPELHMNWRTCDSVPAEMGWLRCIRCGEQVSGGITEDGTRYLISTDHNPTSSLILMGAGLMRMRP